MNAIADALKLADAMTHRAVKRKGLGERVMGGMIRGSSNFGWPGGWSQDRIEQVQHFRSWVFCAVRCVCEEIAGLMPNIAWVRSGAQRRPPRKSWEWDARERRYQKTLHAIQPHEEIEPVEPGHPLRLLFDNPNKWDTAGLADVIYELVMFLELTGNGYWWAVPNLYGQLSRTMQPCELWTVPSQWVWPIAGPRGVNEYTIQPVIGSGGATFPAEEMIHFKYKSPLNKIDGWSPQQAGDEVIDVSESIDRSRFWMNKNMVAPMGVLELDEEYEDPSDEDLDRVYAKFFARAQGESNYGRPLIMPPGGKFVPLKVTPVEMDFLQSADQCRDRTLALWRVPKEIVGIQDAGSEIAMYGPMQQFARYTISPRVRYLGAVMTRCLASRFDGGAAKSGKSLRIWYDDPTPENPETLLKRLDHQQKYGTIMPNEERALFGLEPYTPEQEAKYAKVGGSVAPDKGADSLAPPPGMVPGKKKYEGRYGGRLAVNGHANGSKP